MAIELFKPFVFRELEKRGVKGEILTTNYLNFSEPRALEKLNKLSNITLKMYDVEVQPKSSITVATDYTAYLQAYLL